MNLLHALTLYVVILVLGVAIGSFAGRIAAEVFLSGGYPGAFQ